MASKNGACGCCSRRAWIIGFAFCGVVLLAAGLVFSVGGVFSNLVKEKVNQNVELKPGSLVYKEWTKASTPIYMKYFMFNVTNPIEVLKEGATPNVTQIGPYSYREIRSNEVLNWTSDKSIVTFMPNRTYIFDPETSCAGCDDRNDSFVSVNIPLLTVALWLRNTDYIKHHGLCLLGLQIEALVNHTINLFQRKSIYDILWGYTDPFLDFLKTKPFGCPGQDGLSSFVQLQYNNTYYGISAVNSGQGDISKLEQFTMWRGEKHLSWWSDKYANMLNGTDGTQYSPGVSKDDTLYAFSPEICRSAYFNYESTVTLKDITLYRFIAPDQLYLSGDIYGPNKGFCVPPRCLPTGLLNVSLCQPQNPPIAVSPPHFYQGNKSLVKDVNGLNPTKSAHETYVDVEPITGTVMRAAKRVQINVALEPVDTLVQTNGKFKKVFLPIMYAEESALISDEKAAEFRHKVYRAITLTHVAEYLLIALGALCIIVAVVLLIIPTSKKRRFELRIQKGDSEENKPLVDAGSDGNKVYT